MHRLLPSLIALALALVPGLVLVQPATATQPTITSVTPSSGPVAGGTVVTVRGAGLYGAGQVVVRFGGVEAETTIVQYGTEYQAVAPPHAAGTVDVDMYEAGRNPPVLATLAGAFTYEAPATATAPTISKVSPASGPTTGGTSVTVTGTNFTGATAVAFGGTAATAFTVNGPTSITATTPARDAGAADVQVAAPGGTGTSAAAFTFVVYRTLTIRNVAGLMARGDAQYGATQSDAGAFTTKGTPDGRKAIRNSGYAGGIYCGTRANPRQLVGTRPALSIPGTWMWVPEISSGTACSAAYPTGTKVTLTARPSSSLIALFGGIFGVPITDGLGWLSGWGGACKGTSGLTCTVTMDQDRTASAAFSGSGFNLDLASSPGRFVLFNASTADPETGVVTSFDLGWRTTATTTSPPGFIGFTTQIVDSSANAREHGAAAGPVVCRTRTKLVRWGGRATCAVPPVLAARLAKGPVRLRTSVTLRLRGRSDAALVGYRTTVLRNGAGFGRVTG